MQSQWKYLGYGLTIGIFIAALLIVGLIYATARPGNPSLAPVYTLLISATPAVPTGTPSPANTPAPTATHTPTITVTPVPTATLSTSERMVLQGNLIFSGPLAEDQQKTLYEASIEFIAPTFQESKKVGEMINGAGYGSPTLICGPLSLSILQRAGLIGYQDVIPYDFWLLNPYIGKDRALLDRVFPKDRYESVLYRTPINKFDWSSQPLQPGDFLYIRRGNGGNFDHILVVSRLDSQRRAYSVTNFGTPNGHIIDEVMLYDPNNPAAGIFHTWTEKPYAPLGATGFGGFELWRLHAP